MEITLVFQDGFRVTEDSAIDETQGIVIEDSNGNQFVWIPVKKASDFSQNLSSYPNKDNILSTFSEPKGGYPEERIYCRPSG